MLNRILLRILFALSLNTPAFAHGLDLIECVSRNQFIAADESYRFEISDGTGRSERQADDPALAQPTLQIRYSFQHKTWIHKDSTAPIAIGAATSLSWGLAGCAPTRAQFTMIPADQADARQNGLLEVTLQERIEGRTITLATEYVRLRNIPYGPESGWILRKAEPWAKVRVYRLRESAAVILNP